MSDSHCAHNHHSHMCQASLTASSVYQSLDELEFERGIWYASQYGDLEKVQHLLRNGVNVDARDAAGYTALHYAARNGHLDVCKILLENGADINATTRSGNATALQRACSAGKTNIVKYLLEKKANCMLQDNDGKTALHRATESNNFEICELLVSICPSLKCEADCKGHIPAIYAKNDNLYDLVKPDYFF